MYDSAATVIIELKSIYFEKVLQKLFQLRIFFFIKESRPKCFNDNLFFVFFEIK